MSDEERRAEYEDRWKSGGLSPYYAFTDTLMDEDSNATMAEFAREKIRERVNDPKIAEKLSPDYHILTRACHRRRTSLSSLTATMSIWLI